MSLQNHRTRALMLSLLLVSACVGVAACGGSSKSPSASTNAAAANAATSGPTGIGATGASSGVGASGHVGVSGRVGASGHYGTRLSALRECMEKNGITLPFRPRSGQLASRITRQKLEAALRKCHAPLPSGRFGGAARFHSPAFAQALTKFAACMRENGINLPAPNTSGSGPIFNTSGIDTNSPQFASAERKCRSDLNSALRPGGTGASRE